MKIDTRLPVSNWTHVYHDHKGFFKLPVLFCFFELRILFLFFFFFFFLKQIETLKKNCMDVALKFNLYRGQFTSLL